MPSASCPDGRHLLAQNRAARRRSSIPCPRCGPSGIMGGMEAEPNLAAAPKRKLRWYQFSLRTLLVGVTIFCVLVGGYVAWQATIVRERKAKAAALPVAISNGDVGIPWLRRMLGDVSYEEVWTERGATEQMIDECRHVFPEAQVILTPADALDLVVGARKIWPPLEPKR